MSSAVVAFVANGRCQLSARRPATLDPATPRPPVLIAETITLRNDATRGKCFVLNVLETCSIMRYFDESSDI